jgi:hypothetical protein
MKTWSVLQAELNSAIELMKVAVRTATPYTRHGAEQALRDVTAEIARYQPHSEAEVDERLLAAGALVDLCHEFGSDWLEAVADDIAENYSEEALAPTAAEENGDMRIELAAVGAPLADWQPARRFWNSFLIADPLGIGPFHSVTSTPVSMARHADDFTRLLSATPGNGGELADKLKAVVTFAICRLSPSYGARPMIETDAEGLRQLLLEIVNRPASDFTAAWDGWAAPLSSDDGHPPASDDLKLWRAIRLAPSHWRLQLDRDRQGLSTPTRSPPAGVGHLNKPGTYHPSI